MGSAPLSFAQQRLWFLDRWEPGTPVYNVPRAIRLTGSLDVDALELSLQEIVRRHEILRTTFPVVDGEPVQVVGPASRLALPVIDLLPLAAPEREAAAMKRVGEEARRPFDLARGPLFRIALLRLDDQEHILFLNVHHIVFDGWSSRVLLGELTALYEAFSSGQPSPLPELPIQYAEYARWQREWLQGERLESQLAYWKQQLDGAPAQLSLPTDRPRPVVQTYTGARVPLRLPADLYEALKTLSRQSGVTLFMTLLAAFQTLLHRLSGQEVICVGTPFAGRTHVETERLIGFFANTLVMRADMSRDPSFRKLLARVREVALEAYEHQDVPFEKLVEELQPGRDTSHSPLFQVMFTLLNLPSKDGGQIPNLTFHSLEVDTGTSKFDLTLALTESRDGLTGSIEYNCDLFDAATITRMVGHWHVLLEAVAACPERRISELPLLTEAERRLLLIEWNQTGTEYPRRLLVHRLVEAQAERTPDAIAAVDGGRRLSYRELNRRANQFAHYLRDMGVGSRAEANGLVALCVERSLDMLVALLGILKTGAACLPLDLSCPEARLAYMLREAQPQVLVTQQRLVEKLPALAIPIIPIDAERSAIAAQHDGNPNSEATMESLLYVIYTSGSMGKPKGVAMPHRPLANLVSWQIRNSAAGRGTRTLQFAPLSFDVSFQEIFATLGSGGTLVLIPDELRRDPAALWRHLAEHTVDRLFLPPVALHQLAELVEQQSPLSATASRVAPLREVITAGEPLQITPVVVRMFERLPGCRLQNQYGPTETHVATAFTLTGPPSTWPVLPPIGRPIANTQVYLLGAQQQPVPIGVPGELYIGGEALAQGYLNRPDLTAERFGDFGFWILDFGLPTKSKTPEGWTSLSDPIQNPKSKIQNPLRLYRTGDLARYRADGSIEFLGRRDQQVKIRGFRIELEEVEAALSRHPAVRECVVQAREDSPGDKRLVGYIVPRQQPRPEVAELRRTLLERLPEYMVPSLFVVLGALPLSPSGKVDRQALPAPTTASLMPVGAFVAPADQLEAQLIRIWEEVLGVEPLGVSDSFFDRGGHSLLVARLFVRIEAAFGRALPLSALFGAPTVEQLAGVLRQEGVPNSWSSLVPLRPGGSRPPFFCVHGAGGHVNCYRNLPRYLDPQQPVYGLYGLEVPLAERGAGLISVEEMAAHHLKELHGFQPCGPYYLGGYSFGGVVAFEMACQLCALGEQVALLALLDTGAPGARRRRLAQTIRRQREKVRQLGPKETLRRVLERTGAWGLTLRERVGQMAAPRSSRPATVTPTQEIEVWNPVRVNLEALHRYRPQVYPGRVTLFRPGSPPENAGPGDFDKGWGRWAAGGLEIIEVPGDHLTIVQEPHVRVLAERLDACLQGAQAKAVPDAARVDGPGAVPASRPAR